MFYQSGNISVRFFISPQHFKGNIPIPLLGISVNKEPGKGSWARGAENSAERPFYHSNSTKGAKPQYPEVKSPSWN